MASTPIATMRRKILDDLGEEEVFWMYVDEYRTVQEMVSALFIPHGDAEKPSRKDFYDWLNAEEGRWDRWEATKRFKADHCAEDALATALNSDESNVRSSKLKADYLKWYAGVLSPVYSDRHQSLDVRVRHEAAVREAEVLKGLDELVRSMRESGSLLTGVGDLDSGGGR